MLEEAVEVIRDLLTGELITHHGPHYTVETARLYSVPDQPPPMFMSGFGEKAIKLAARIGDGYMSVSPTPASSGCTANPAAATGRCRAASRSAGPDAGHCPQDDAPAVATDSIPGEAAQLLPLPRHFGQLAQLVHRGQVPQPCGPDPGIHADAIRPTPMPASTRSTSARSAARPRGSSSSTPGRCCRGCAKPKTGTSKVLAGHV